MCCVHKSRKSDFWDILVEISFKNWFWKISEKSENFENVKTNLILLLISSLKNFGVLSSKIVEIIISRKFLLRYPWKTDFGEFQKKVKFSKMWKKLIALLTAFLENFGVLSSKIVKKNISGTSLISIPEKKLFYNFSSKNKTRKLSEGYIL